MSEVDPWSRRRDTTELIVSLLNRAAPPDRPAGRDGGFAALEERQRRDALARAVARQARRFSLGPVHEPLRLVVTVVGRTLTKLSPRPTHD